jgi:hypothetical protein
LLLKKKIGKQLSLMVLLWFVNGCLFYSIGAFNNALLHIKIDKK